MGLELYDYQKKAVNQMKNGCILCGGVGSGKSRTALAYYFFQEGGELLGNAAGDNYMPMEDPPRDLYIITTARKRDTKEWEGELSPFLLSTDHKVSLYSNTVIVDSWNNIKKYAEVTDAFFIFDEQRVVGSGTWVKSFLRIAKNNQWVLLSATPGDTWQDYIPVFIANGFYQNRTEFTREHIVYSRFSKYPKVDRYLNTGRLIRQRNDILVNMDFERATVSHHEDVFVKYDVEKYKDVSRTRWDPYKNWKFSGRCFSVVQIAEIPGILKWQSGMDISISRFRKLRAGYIWFSTMQGLRVGTVSRLTRLYFTLRIIPTRLCSSQRGELTG